MKILFEGSKELSYTLLEVSNAIANIGLYFVGTTRNMPDMTSVVLVEQGPKFVTFKTNEGLVKRTNIDIRIADERISVEYAEEYWAGKHIAAISHVMDVFTPGQTGVEHSITISGVEAPGFGRFFTRSLDVPGLGEALLAAQHAHIEAQVG